VLALVGIEQQPLLTSSSQALFSIVLILTWIVAGYWMTVLTAGLYDIPREFYEAATIDGGGGWRVFRSITLPLLRRPLLFVVVASTVSNFLAFAPAQILTHGGPASSTNVIMYEIYTEAFTNFDLGLASAEITICLLVLGALVSVQFRLLGREES
jgi:multiple sugar transport system permease protein